MPGLYQQSEEEVRKPPPKSNRRKKSSGSCKDDWLNKVMKDDDTDSSGAMQIVQNNPYAFHEEQEEQDDDQSQQQAGNDEDDSATASANDGFSTPLGSSLSFKNPQLSQSLGSLNNLYRSTGWVKTHCGGGSPSASNHLPDLGIEDDGEDDTEQPGSMDPMWGNIEKAGSDEDIQMFEDPLADSTRSESDMEKVEYLTFLHTNNEMVLDD